MNAVKEPLVLDLEPEPKAAPGPLQVVRPAQLMAPTPAHLLQAAIDKGMGIEAIEKFMDLQDRWEKREAEKAFVAAITQFKQNPPEIVKRKRVFFESSKGDVDYMHAELADVCAAAIRGLAEVGISHRWELKQEGDRITVTCILTHAMGHSERTMLTGSPDNSGSKNNIQAVGSTVTYLERYTLMAATGLAAKGMDTDGRGGGGPQLISPQQVMDLEALISEHGLNRTNVLKWLKVEKLEDLQAQHYTAAVQGLRAKVQAKNSTQQKAG